MPAGTGYADRPQGTVPPRVDEHERIYKRWKALEKERSSWDAHWRDIADHLIPRQMKFNRTDHNQGTKTNNKILNGSATRALRILASGMMAGVASPSRAWFRLITNDPNLNAMLEVKRYLREVERRAQIVFARSNFYQAFGKMFVVLPAFCTAPVFIEDDDLDVIRCYGIPLGSYCLASDARKEINTMYRETVLTVAQLVERFEYDNCSSRVQSMYDQGNLDQPIDVLHAVEPNPEYLPGRRMAQNKKFRSSWLEIGNRNEKLLGVRGFDDFPVVCPRWDVEDGDTYGHGPGMDALPDIKELQFSTKMLSKLKAKLTDPTINAPASMRNAGNFITQMPNGVNWVPEAGAGERVEPLYTPDINAVTVMKQDIDDLIERIGGHFMADLFLMMAQAVRGNITAREVAERHEEKILQLGPAMERVQGEALRPAIFRTMGLMGRRGHLPPMPEALKGVEVRIEYISPLAQGQKMLDAAGIERWVQFIVEAAKADERVLDVVEWDETALEYAEVVGAPPKVIRDKAQVDAIRDQRAQEAEAAQMAEMAKAAQAGAGAVKNIAEAQVENPDALARLGELQNIRRAQG